MTVQQAKNVLIVVQYIVTGTPGSLHIRGGQIWYTQLEVRVAVAAQRLEERPAEHCVGSADTSDYISSVS